MNDLRLLYETSPVGEQSVKTYCCYHKDNVTPSLAVYSDHVYCFTCRKSANAVQYLIDKDNVSVIEAMHTLNNLIAVDIVPTKQAKIIDTAWLQDVDKWTGNSKAIEYFTNRGFTMGTISKAKLGHNGRSYTIPIFDNQNNLVWLKYRRDDALDTTGPKYVQQRNGPGSVLYYPPLRLWSGYAGVVIVTEGELDALILAQTGMPAITATGGVNSLEKLLRTIPNDLILCLDQDIPGRQAASDLQAKLRHKVIDGVHWDKAKYGKDVTEIFLNGKSDMLVSRLDKALGIKRALAV